MSPALMSSEVRDEIQSLSRQAKQELMALLNNNAAIVIGNASLIADDDRTIQASRHKARVIARCALEGLNEVREVLGVRDPNNHLGATEL